MAETNGWDPRHRSKTVLDGVERAPNRTYFRATGLSAEDLQNAAEIAAAESAFDERVSRCRPLGEKSESITIGGVFDSNNRAACEVAQRRIA